MAGETLVSESLVIRLGTNAQQPVHWLVWSAQEPVSYTHLTLPTKA
mgnify:CR=1 FL=1